MWQTLVSAEHKANARKFPSLVGFVCKNFAIWYLSERFFAQALKMNIKNRFENIAVVKLN